MIIAVHSGPSLSPTRERDGSVNAAFCDPMKSRFLFLCLSVPFYFACFPVCFPFLVKVSGYLGASLGLFLFIRCFWCLWCEAPGGSWLSLARFLLCCFSAGFLVVPFFICFLSALFFSFSFCLFCVLPRRLPPVIFQRNICHALV